MTHMYIGYPVDISIYTYTLSCTCVYRKCLYMYTIYIYIQTHVPYPYVYSYTHNPAIHTLYPHLNPANTYVHSYTIIFISLPFFHVHKTTSWQYFYTSSTTQRHLSI